MMRRKRRRSGAWLHHCWQAAAIFSLAIGGLAAAAHAESFDPAWVYRDNVATEAECAPHVADRTAVWVVVAGRGECIRYYSAGLDPDRPNSLALVFMTGDLINDGSSPRRNQAYVQAPTTDAVLDFAARRARNFGVPFVFLGRPGTWNSSGDHRRRRSYREMDILDAALSAIRARYRIGRFGLAGQSGGSIAIANLLSMRDDILCAAMASGAVSPRRRAELINRHTDPTGQPWSAIRDPLVEARSIPHQPERRIFVIGDPRDRTVPFGAQQEWADAVSGLGHSVQLWALPQAPAPRHHSLAAYGYTAAAMCLRGYPDDRIRQALDTASPGASPLRP
jgi:hypothetical protein